jgi:hypothetical protein
MRRNLYVPLPAPAREALFRLAGQEWRNPKEQAALLLTEALRAHGALSDDTAPAEPLSEVAAPCPTGGGA